MSLLQMRSTGGTVETWMRAAGWPSLVFRYALPFVALATAIGATYLLDVVSPESPNLFLFFVAIVVSAWFGGPGPGWVSVVLSTLSADYFFIPPLYVLDFARKDIAWLLAFIACTVAANALSLQRRRAETLLVKARDDLEIRVRERTADLQKSNARLASETSERARAEADLREAQGEFARVARIMTVGELTASIAHEVNQPLAAVVANGNAALNWLQRDPPALAEVQDSVAAIVTAGERAGEVISRIRSLMTKEPPALASANVNDLINGVLSLVQPSLKKLNVILESHLDPDLRLVFGDRVQLQQLMLNLLNNAVEAMADVADRPRQLIVRTEQAADGKIVIAVEDSGRGFGDADLKKLFHPFYTTKRDGMGMGLSICRTIAECHRGKISAAARSPCGAIFRVALPAGART
jgi:C4-dicarboxylate-specific signal transduction histidine kinase